MSLGRSGSGALLGPPRTGKIVAVVGPMYSGKTSEIMRLSERYRIAGRTVLSLTHADDTRYGTECFATHNKVQAKAVQVNSLRDASIVDRVAEADVIAVDEGQMFEDLGEPCNEWADTGKTVIVAALDMDFRRKPFESVAGLGAEEIVKLSAVCKCGSEAYFSFRITSATERVVVGGTETYEAVCRACYNEKSAAKAVSEV